jgi:hypothetical protein
MDVHIHSDATNAVNWRIYNNDQPDLVSPVFNIDPSSPTAAYFTASSYSFGAGEKLTAIRNISKHVRGSTYSVQLSGSSLATPSSCRIYAFMLHVAEGGIRRTN